MTLPVPMEDRRWRKTVPAEHRGSLDTRLAWLWNQRFGTVQSIWRVSPDLLDKTACTLVLQAILARDLASIELLFQRIEGGSEEDTTIQERIRI